MNQPTRQDQPAEAIWRPLTGLPKEAETWIFPGHNELVSEWIQLNLQLEHEQPDNTLLDIWYKERQREFAIHTGQIEGLYTLKPGVTAHLITEGFKNVVSTHTHEGVKTATLKGLLEDQESALEMVFNDIKDNKPLDHDVVFNWHRHITRHQETLHGIIAMDGKLHRVDIPFELKGQYKKTPNSLVRGNNIIFEFCPPERTYEEMSRLFDLYADTRTRNLPAHVEAAWLHHRFVRTHPFQDGNGRVSRLLMSYVYLCRGEPSPIITTDGKPIYTQALREADRGNLKAFSDHLAELAAQQLRSIILTSKNALEEHSRYYHCNGGITDNGTYSPPDKDDTEDELEL